MHTTTKTTKFCFVFEMSDYYETLVEMFRQKDFRFFNPKFLSLETFLLLKNVEKGDLLRMDINFEYEIQNYIRTNLT